MPNYTAKIEIKASENLSKVSKKAAKGLGAIDKDAKKSNKSLERLNRTAKKLGKSLASSVGRFARRGAFAFGAASIAGFKFASDADEIRSKFGVVFRDIRGEAEATADTFAKEFGLAGSTSRKLLANTADLLSGFGFTQEAALDLSEQTNRLASDLASFSNIQGGAKRASEALTKGLLGERESMKELGIAIREADIAEELKKRGLAGLTGRELVAAKAVVTLDLAFEQSANAIGDYARTQDSAANQMRLTQERLKEFTERFGKEVIMPLAENVLPAINKFLGDEERVSALLDKIKTSIEITADVIVGVYNVLKDIHDFLTTTPTEVAAAVGVAQESVRQTFGLPRLPGSPSTGGELNIRMTVDQDGRPMRVLAEPAEGISFEAEIPIMLPALGQ